LRLLIYEAARQLFDSHFSALVGGAPICISCNFLLGAGARAEAISAATIGASEFLGRGDENKELRACLRFSIRYIAERERERKPNKPNASKHANICARGE